MSRRPNRTHTGTLLGVWAHPDDEAYMSAGVMTTAIRGGQRVALATATRGELGTDDPVRNPPSRLARLRERELASWRRYSPTCGPTRSSPSDRTG